MDGNTIRLRVLLAYDGTDFHGFAYQGQDTPTVALSLRKAFAPMLGHQPEVTVAGRTDAGVHAWGQVVSLDISRTSFERYGCQRIKQSLNRQLPKSIVIREVAEAAPDFSARFSATGRSYRYTIRTAPQASPFVVNTQWHLCEDLDLEAMNRGARALIGEWDFSSFCRRPPDVDGEPASMSRRIESAEFIQLDEDTVRFDVSANAFCHQQVRSMTGLLVAIGRGRRETDEVAAIRDAKNRKVAVTPAPPQGLCLWEVRY